MIQNNNALKQTLLLAYSSCPYYPTIEVGRRWLHLTSFKTCEEFFCNEAAKFVNQAPCKTKLFWAPGLSFLLSMGSDAYTLSTGTTNKVLLAVEWYWQSYQQSADFHCELWHPGISWSRNNISVLKDFKFLLLIGEVQDWIWVTEECFERSEITAGVLPTIVEGKTRGGKRKQPCSPLFGILSFNSPWVLYPIFIRLTSPLYSLQSSVRNYRHHNLLATLSGKPWEVSNMSQCNDIFLPGTKIAFIII